MGDANHLIHSRGWHHHCSVIVAYHGVSGSNEDSATLNGVIDLPGPKLGRTLLGGCISGIDRETITLERIAVASGAVSDQATGLPLHHAQEFYVPPDGAVFPAHGINDQDFLGTAQFDGDIFSRLITLGFVRNQVGPVGHEPKRHCTAGHVLTWLEWFGAVDETHRPAHHPESINQGLRRNVA